MGAGSAVWPDIPYLGWQQTAATLHLWTQIVGKVRLSLTPWVNHSWQVPLYVTTRGLGTSPIPFGTESVEMEFDFIAHRLLFRTSRGDEPTLPLEPQSVADFYSGIIGVLRKLGVPVRINDLPCELPDPLHFTQDRTHGAYDADAVHRFWRALLQIDRILKLFRTGFIGKVSPVHFFWGSFDLAVTRFSGRPAPPHPGGVPGLSDAVAREAYSHEVSSAGFWPGSPNFPLAAFYSYAYPEPDGIRSARLPPGAYYDTALGEFILPYDAVRTAVDPQTTLLEFLSMTYEAAATAGQWERAALECDLGGTGTGAPDLTIPVSSGEAGETICPRITERANSSALGAPWQTPSNAGAYGLRPRRMADPTPDETYDSYHGLN